MLREHTHAMDGKQQLKIHRLLTPQRTVVIKGAMRWAGGTKSGDPSAATVATKAMMELFAAPSFHEGSDPEHG
ncbi:MAG: hypothetical protein R3C56_21790 [Pirellulaceae bacterium]